MHKLQVLVNNNVINIGPLIIRAQLGSSHLGFHCYCTQILARESLESSLTWLAADTGCWLQAAPSATYRPRGLSSFDNLHIITLLIWHLASPGGNVPSLIPGFFWLTLRSHKVSLVSAGYKQVTKDHPDSRGGDTGPISKRGRLIGNLWRLPYKAKLFRFTSKGINQRLWI